MGLESQRSSPLGPKGGSDLQEEAPDGLKQDYGSKTRPSPQSLRGGLALALASPKPQSGHSIPHSIPTSPDPRYTELASMASAMQDLIKEMKAGLALGLPVV